MVNQDICRVGFQRFGPAHDITVALDDFVTGCSGLYHLTRLAIDKIKIDRSFLEASQPHHLPMVEAIGFLYGRPLDSLDTTLSGPLCPSLFNPLISAWLSPSEPASTPPPRP